MVRALRKRTGVIILSCIVWVSSGGFCVSPKNVEFDGKTYQLAHREEKNGGFLEEYVVSGETIDRWTTLIAIRYFAGEKMSPETAVRNKAAWREQNYPDGSHAIYIQNKGASAMIDFLIYAYEPKVIHEFNIEKYMTSPKGLISYQFAYRGYGELNDPQNFFAKTLKSKRKHWVDLMSTAHFSQ